MKFNELLVGGGWDPQVDWPWGFIIGMSYLHSTERVSINRIYRGL